MIRIVPVRRADLAGAHDFGFRTRHKHRTKRSLKHHSSADQQEQARELALVEARLTALQYLACEGTCSVGISSGREVFEGEIQVFERGSERKAHYILEDLQQHAQTFAKNHPESGFTIEFSQTFTVTRVNRGGTFH